MTFIADPRQIVPTTIDAASQYDGAVSGSAYRQLTLHCSPQQLSRLSTYFVDSVNQDRGDRLFYDVGTLCIFSDQVPIQTQSLGKLRFDYELELLQPVAVTEVGQFTDYLSNSPSKPYDEITTNNLEDSLYVSPSVPTRIYASRPGTYDIQNYIKYDTGVPSVTYSYSNSTMSSLGSFVNGSAATGLHTWVVTAEQVALGAYFTLTQALSATALTVIKTQIAKIAL